MCLVAVSKDLAKFFCNGRAMPTIEEIPPPPPPTQLVKPVTAGQAMKILGKFQPEATPAGNESPTEAAPSSAAAPEVKPELKLMGGSGYKGAHETEADVHARVDFEMALRRLQGNHVLFKELSFKGCQLTRRPDWMPQLCEALTVNDTVTALDLSDSGLNDGALQQLAIALCVPSRCPKLRKLNLSGNAGLSVAGETMAQGLCRLRKDFEVVIGPGFDHTAATFGCDKQLVENLSAWPCDTLKVPNGGPQDFLCPSQIAGEGVQLELKRGFQGTNGTKYTCDLAEFSLGHNTGNMVLVKLKNREKVGVEV